MGLKQKIKHKIFSIVTKLIGSEDEKVTLPVLTGPARGLSLKLDFKTREESHYFFGDYELEAIKFILKICKKGWTVWDCGAYIGYYTVLFARLVGPGGHVVAFEPDHKNMARLKENVAINKFNNVQFVEAAIGAPLGETYFALSNSSNSHIPGTYVGATMEDYVKLEKIDNVVKVKCMSLDQAYLDKDIPVPNLIKIDIDGAEVEALKHIHILADKARPLILLEVHNPEGDKAAFEFAHSHRYHLRSLKNGRILNKVDEVEDRLCCAPIDLVL